jgi:hypothetical protein
MIAEHSPADKPRSNEKGELTEAKKRPSRPEPGRLLEIHDGATHYGFGVAGVAGFGAGLVAGAEVLAFTG